ncbi:hypothetical protein PTSG_12112 [Salpingoeca rosetta]|uniref:PX domain-containing protein n=1 Tax=Salpingoeca rosetta (strain ATCC 50818 / BSB-021) TaxID=946362 RepID=F2U7H1_SALR5|nr:uncharacterized protein PTSG_12112 [Salpingoeca rosetta]EGD83388.1 hypothetical protein PTSG_12112 [Salpingoeca rosetta]|eukprot:XP_004994892.1 hypothetical protein PTSG_12112 [Salpingoeca rosetta]
MEGGGEDVVTAQPTAGTSGEPLPPEGFLVTIPKFQEKIDTSGSYMTYVITSEFGPDNVLNITSGEYAVHRRYNEFSHLVSYLRAALPYVIVPPIPEKKLNFKWKQMAVDVTDEVFVGKRRIVLEDFLRRCLDHPLIRMDKGFQAFLLEQDWMEDLMVEGFDGEMHPFTGAEWLSSLRAMTASRATEPQLLEVKHFKALGASTSQHVGVLLNAHAGLAYKAQALSAFFKDFADVLTELCELMPKLAAPFKSASARISRMGDATVWRLQQEERAFVDTLVAFMGYTDSISAFVKNEEIAFAAKVRARDAHASKVATITALERPDEDKSLSGFFTRLATTEASKASKIEALKSEAEHLKLVAETAEQQHKDFLQEALKEMKRFSATKRHELLSIFKDYARLQKEHAHHIAKMWTDIKQAVSAPQP